MGHKIADYIRKTLALKPAGEDSQYDELVGIVLEELPKLETDALIGRTVRRAVEVNINAPSDRVLMDMGFEGGRMTAVVLSPDQVPGKSTSGSEEPAEATGEDTGLRARVKALEAHTHALRGPRSLSREGQAYRDRVEELAKRLDPSAFSPDPHAPLRALGGIVRELMSWLMDIDTGNLRHDDPEPAPESEDTHEWAESRDAWLDKHYPRPATMEHKAARAAWDAARSEVTNLEVRAARFFGSARSLADKTRKMMRLLERNLMPSGLGAYGETITNIRSHCEELLEDPWPSPEKDWDEEIGDG